MLKTDAHRIIDEYRVKVGDENQKHNVLSQAGIRCCAGKWAVPDSKYQKFLECIDRTLAKSEDAELYFLEVPNETHNIIKVDMDLRFAATEYELKQRSPLDRRYTNDLIQLVIDILAANIAKMIETPEHYKIYVQEKQKPRIAYQEKQIKDGIHIIIPELVLSNTALYYLREQIITNPELIEMLKEIGNITDIGDVIIGAVNDIIPGSKIKKGQVCRAVIVRTKSKISRPDGSFVKFGDNAVVLVNKDGDPIATRIFGPVAREVRKKKFLKIASLASEVL